ncbi:hypothetical protein FOMG_02400 [Fusarium oxysporum f. sp. melonis 26406]|uniref:Uncharacterized protein n=1 Tax=Fusarium oxysporum f. sp. melonis 26406 TaxID=1089452 RepID=X0AS76_FUSOX|nr:hypothetical protein FOMG_02400 [Fusarium oxysporum f. sp. melonis 26406]
MTKVLMNPTATKKPQRPVTPPTPEKGPSECLFKAPRSTAKVRRALACIPPSITIDPTVRLVLGRVGAQLGRQSIELEEKIREIKLLKQLSEELQPQKRRKVTFDSNANFAKVPAIKRPWLLATLESPFLVKSSKGSQDSLQDEL